MSNKAEREMIVRTLRDVALHIVTTKHSVERFPGLPGPVFKASFGSLEILLRTPDTGGFSQPYGIEVWAGGKVLNVGWDHTDVLDVVSFRRGQWEQELLAVEPVYR